ncbi:MULTISPECIES: hypothetical protein [Streptomyces]|uniref:Uncharacterized protein n=2 Tax=Streptomyces TaxID=1883 RepID=A0A918F377_9ACTN|nr:hypothetical protein [Streptomyces pilosus]GGQ96981.1 hypothetical protein GCM10010280_50810 [Streptomyces pilosus]
MVDPSQEPGTRDEAADAPGHAASAGMPRWVKLSGLVVLILAVLVAVMLLVHGPGGHGPGRHFGGQAPLVGVTAGTGQAAGGGDG